MSNVSLTFANVFQKLPLLVSAFANEPCEENFSENYQVLQNKYTENFCLEGNYFRKIDYLSKSCFQILVFDKHVKWLQTRK